MKRPDQREQSGSSLTAWLPVLAAVAIMATGCVSTFLVLELDEFRPKVGDIVVFRPGSQDTDTWQMEIPATVVPAVARRRPLARSTQMSWRRMVEALWLRADRMSL